MVSFGGSIPSHLCVTIVLAAAEDIRYTVLTIGDRKRQTHEAPATEEWEDVCSFFIYNLAQERVSAIGISH